MNNACDIQDPEKKEERKNENKVVSRKIWEYQRMIRFLRGEMMQYQKTRMREYEGLMRECELEVSISTRETMRRIEM